MRLNFFLQFFFLVLHHDCADGLAGWSPRGVWERGGGHGGRARGRETRIPIWKGLQEGRDRRLRRTLISLAGVIESPGNHRLIPFLYVYFFVITLNTKPLRTTDI